MAKTRQRTRRGTKQADAAHPVRPKASLFNAPLNLRQMLRTAEKVQANGWQQMVRLNQERLEFLNRRLERDCELVNDLADIKNPAKAVSACVEFYQAAKRDYADAALRLTEFYADGARAATADILQQIEETAAVASNDALTTASAAKAQAG